MRPALQPCLQVAQPAGGFYFWAKIPQQARVDDELFAQQLNAHYNVTVLPGSYLARQHQGAHPGRGRLRIALVAPVEHCLEAAERIADYCKTL